MAENSKTPLIECRNLTKQFRAPGRKAVNAVNGLSLSILQGETFGLVGESGCGKSTLANMIVKLLEPSSGSVLYNGTDISALKGSAEKDFRRHVQIIFQDPFASLTPGKTAGFLVKEPLVIHHIGRTDAERIKIAENMFERTGFDRSVKDMYPEELSGGQRQRIAIASAMILNPSFVVCDEAVSALDVSIQAQILNLLKELQDSLHLTYLFISHNLNAVSYMADRIGVMYTGNIVELGTSEQLTSSPMHPYTQALFHAAAGNDAPFRESKVLEGEVPDPSQLPEGCTFHTRCPYCSEICRREKPQLSVQNDGRLCACHFTGNLQ